MYVSSTPYSVNIRARVMSCLSVHRNYAIEFKFILGDLRYAISDVIYTSVARLTDSSNNNNKKKKRRTSNAYPYKYSVLRAVPKTSERQQTRDR